MNRITKELTKRITLSYPIKNKYFCEYLLNDEGEKILEDILFNNEYVYNYNIDMGMTTRLCTIDFKHSTSETVIDDIATAIINKLSDSKYHI